jgi:XTP/dITP diphosphohydrolase
LIIDGNETQFEGICNGKIIDTPQGTEGFGYDPIFIPDGSNEVLLKCRSKKRTDLTIEQKLRLNWSHFCKT